MQSQLPPGPRLPSPLQTLGFWSRPTAFLDRCRARYGSRYTIRLFGVPPFVILCDPEDIREVFQAPPDVLHPGEGARILEPIVGPHSVILLDEQPHLEQRRLLLPAFHGERMQRLAGLMAELAEQEVASWPREEALALHPRLQRLTLEIILRAVFGLERGAQLEELREILTEVLRFAESPLSLLPPPPRALARFGPTGRLERLGARADELIFALIEERRAPATRGEDVLALLLGARHEDGSPMSPQELRDELVTALVAGHETTASQLAWALERLAREPAVVARLYAELQEDDGEEYLTATINEIMRLRPVLPNAEPRLVKRPVEIGGVDLPARGGAGRQRLPRPPRPRDLPRPARVPAGALPRVRGREPPGHLHVDPLRRRPAAVPGRELRHARDEARAARRAGELRAAAGRRARGRAPAQHHDQPRARVLRDPARAPRARRVRGGAGGRAARCLTEPLAA